MFSAVLPRKAIRFCQRNLEDVVEGALVVQHVIAHREERLPPIDVALRRRHPLDVTDQIVDFESRS